MTNAADLFALIASDVDPQVMAGRDVDPQVWPGSSSSCAPRRCGPELVLLRNGGTHHAAHRDGRRFSFMVSTATRLALVCRALEPHGWWHARGHHVLEATIAQCPPNRRLLGVASVPAVVPPHSSPHLP
jgi:hypothetical protein